MYTAFPESRHIPELNDYKPVDGHGMCNVVGWRLHQGQPFLQLASVRGAKAELDLAAEAKKLGWDIMRDLVAFVGRVASADSAVTPFYVHLHRLLWSSFEHRGQICKPNQ